MEKDKIINITSKSYHDNGEEKINIQFLLIRRKTEKYIEVNYYNIGFIPTIRVWSS